MTDLTALSVELTTDELARGYSGMTNAQASDDLNSYYRTGESSISKMLQYCIENRSRTDTNGDTMQLPILGRLWEVADAELGADPFSTAVAAHHVTLEMRTWARTFYTIMITPVTTIDLTGMEVDAGFTALGPGNGVVWKDPDIAALKSLSENLQTRAMEIGCGKINEGDVRAARSLDARSTRSP